MEKFNIGMMTTWNSSCGIAAYSANLCKELAEYANIVLFTNRNNIATSSPYEQKVFGVKWWGEEPSIDINRIMETIAEFEKEFGRLDLFHIQYQSSLYEEEGFNNLLRSLNYPIIITQHDSTTNQKHVFPEGVKKIVHNRSIPGDFYIEFPTTYVRPSVVSFGMGRNNYDFIKSTCDELGIDFISWDARKQGWLSQEELIRMIKSCDVVVLWYNEVPIQGQSSALRLAISCHRPVIVNDVGWFNDAPKFVKVVWDKESLKNAIIDALKLDFILSNSYKNCAIKHIKIYDEIS